MKKIYATIAITIFLINSLPLQGMWIPRLQNIAHRTSYRQFSTNNSYNGFYNFFYKPQLPRSLQDEKKVLEKQYSKDQNKSLQAAQQINKEPSMLRMFFNYLQGKSPKTVITEKELVVNDSLNQMKLTGTYLKEVKKAIKKQDIELGSKE